MFRQAYLCEDTLGVWNDENHLIVRWHGGVFFSFTQMGDAISAHFSAGPEALRNVKEAINDFCSWAFYVMPWCKMIFACVTIKSVTRIIWKCGFVPLAIADDAEILVRYR